MRRHRRRTLRGHTLRGGADDCAICFAPLDAGATGSTSCGHTFHRVCLGKWMDHQTTCPTCRGSLNTTADLLAFGPSAPAGWKPVETLGDGFSAWGRTDGVTAKGQPIMLVYRGRQLAAVYERGDQYRYTNTAAGQQFERKVNQCSLCRAELSLGPFARTVCCHSQFHTDCMNRYMCGSMICPFCRQSLDVPGTLMAFRPCYPIGYSLPVDSATLGHVERHGKRQVLVYKGNDLVDVVPIGL